ncbi:hydroxyacid dehydrogenase [Carnobacterium sp. CS13]|uniref:hydroxyacid dehydrogenase n=1 Tax=Carnobacterium sp. CS13 TaxID=2800128 RepID=UPI001914125E|nr:hydroxyacid dehydrogenase [Carnobacterium sp. CS13]QQP70011.1 hydroxyacid dehydrogenase [Carnobacterium sp. CS13]
MDKNIVNQVYPDDVQNEIRTLVEITALPLSKQEVEEDKTILNDIDFIFSSWGGPTLDEDFLKHAPKLKALFYAAGSVKKIVTEDSWKAGIKIMNANVANAIPVAEYALSQILFSLKDGWQMTRKLRETKVYPEIPYINVVGAYKSTVGLISLSAVGRKTIELLQPFDLEVIAYDPFVSEEEAKELNVKLCSLEEVFQKSDVVSLHSPLLKETTGMITGELIVSMKDYATFINTARGAIVKEDEMVEILKRRTDLTAILDVTCPEPPPKTSMLYTLPNVVLTPHIAGSMGGEMGRMGAYMLEELKRYLDNKPLDWEITEEAFKHMA